MDKCHEKPGIPYYPGRRTNWNLAKNIPSGFILTVVIFVISIVYFHQLNVHIAKDQMHLMITTCI